MGRYNVFRNLSLLLSFLQRVNVRLFHLGLSVLMLVALVFVQTYAVQLMFLLIDGIVRDDYSVVHSMAVPGTLVRGDNKALLLISLVIWSYVITVLKSALQYASQLTIAHQARNAALSIRTLIFNRYLQFGKMFFDRNDVAGLSHVVMSSTDAIGNKIVAFQQLLSQLVTLGVYIVLMLRVSPLLTLTVMSILPLINLVSLYFVKRIKSRSIAHHQSAVLLNKKMFNILTCIPLVQGYGKEEEERRLFAETSDKEVAAAYDMARMTNLISPVQDVFQTTALLMAACALAYLGSRQHLQSSEILIFFYMAFRAVPMSGALSGFATAMAGIEGPIAAIKQVLSDDDKFIVEQGSGQFDGLRQAIEFRDLHFAYLPNNPVLRGINLSIPCGRMVAIVGATGAGKTTTVSLLLRFYDCPPGSILVDGKDIRSFTSLSLRRHMAFVSQESFIFNDTLRANLTYAAGDCSDHRIFEVLKQARLYEYVLSLPQGLDTVVGDHGVKLSGGEKQRLALARALLRDADILILDEATSSLDSITERLIQEALDEAVRGRTTIVIAHRLSTIRRADRVAVFHQGQVVEEGSIDHLLAQRGHFCELWETQLLGTEELMGEAAH